MKKVGRPSKFKPEFIEMARVACAELEATDQELANLFAVDIATIQRWKNEHPQFCDTIKSAKEAADKRVEMALFKRATGYTQKRTEVSSEGNTIEITKEILADPVSMIFWLKNRQRDRWRDKQDHEITGKDGLPLAVINFGTPPKE